MQGSTVNAASVADLLTRQASLQSPIAGYHVLAGAHPSSSLAAGQTLPTVDVMRTPGQPDKAVSITVTGPLQACGSPCPEPVLQYGFLLHGGESMCIAWLWHHACPPCWCLHCHASRMHI